MSDFPCIDLHSHQVPETSRWTIYNRILPRENGRLLRENFWYSAGIHPWYLPEDYTLSIQKLEELCRLNKLLAIGECGIDRTISTSITKQEEAFIAQMELSEKYEIPLIIHAVKSLSDMAALRKRHKPLQAWILHDYRPKASLTENLQKLGFHFSIGPGFIQSSANTKLKALPYPDRLFLETDASNTPIEDVYRCFAQLVGKDESEIREQIVNNFVHTFNHLETEDGLVR